jgi:hypothetical protein
MKLKLPLIVLYASILLASAVLSGKTHASVDTQAQRINIGLDTSGRRGLVLFDHKVHEAEINPDPAFPHKARQGVACIGCHHTVEEITDRKQFRKCSDCHKSEGDPDNKEDKQGIELNSREIYHRLCISCHRAGNLKASDARYKDATFTKCSECHDRDAAAMAVAPAVEEQPLAMERPRIVRQPAPQPEGPAQNPVDPPLGYVGRPRKVSTTAADQDAVIRDDRWRIGFPDDPRYKLGRLLNPYRQNLLKGDYPVLGQHNFLVVTAESESSINARRLPVPSDVSAQNPESAEFFGRGNQFLFSQDFVVSIEMFHGDTAFKPVDWRVHVTPTFNVNYLHTQENGIVNIDPRRGNARTDAYISLEDAFGEVRLGDTTRLIPFLRGAGSRNGESPYFDTTSIRAGIQPFVSDFRGFIFSDVNLGARLFGNVGNNRYQFNAAYFNMLEKDTNSELNTPHFRDQAVFVANLFRQDTFRHGYTTEFSFHFNDDRPSRHFDENRFLVRPALIGDVLPHGLKVAYLGWAGDGHLGRLNLTHAFYEALGHDTNNPIAGRRVDINAQMAAAELSMDRDWLRLRGSFFWASGDKNPFDGTARGFDSIVDFPEFAGGKFSFWNSQEIRLTQTGVALVSGDSLLPSLRSSKNEGQANFVNPGLFLYNIGADSELTPKLKAVFNLNYLRFHHTEPLEALLFQPHIRGDIGLDYGLGVQYRPFLNENAVFAAGFSSLVPGGGFRDIYSSICSGEGCGAKSRVLYSAFVRLKFTY